LLNNFIDPYQKELLGYTSLDERDSLPVILTMRTRGILTGKM